jgi:hypothetical protein
MWRAVLAVLGEPGSTPPPIGGVDVLDISHPPTAALSLADGGETPILIASHPAHDHATRVTCALLAGMRPDVPVAHVSRSQAPLVSLVALSMGYELAVDAGHAAGTWADLSRDSWSAVVLKSVAGLDQPNPTLWQHATSWLPGSRFLVRLSPDPATFSMRRSGRAVDGIARGTRGLYLSVPGDEDVLTRVVSSLVAAPWQRVLSVPGSWRSVLGSDETLQLALVPADPRSSVRAPGPRCRVCGLSTTDGRCPFCHVRSVVDQRGSDLRPHSRGELASMGRTT